MRILGFLETSLVDWDGMLSSVVFVGGCNFRCPFCHNHELADDHPGLPEVDWAEIQVTLVRKDKWIDGVVVTGGEPVMHPEVFDLCAGIKQLGKKVKIDTNGSFPYQLEGLIERRLVDYVAMDIKAPIDAARYSRAAGHPVEPAVLKRTIRLLRESGIPHEFRSTLVRGLIDPSDIEQIGAAVRGVALLVLQRYHPDRARVSGFGDRYSLAEAESMAASLRPFVSEVRLRGKWD